MDGDSLFGVSGLIMESPADGDHRDASNTIRENHVLPDIKSLTRSNGIHQMPEFLDDPFPAPDWVLFPPADFYRDSTYNGFQTTSTSDLWGEDTDIFQPFKEKADPDVTHSISANQNTESCSSSNRRDPLLEFILSRQKKSQATPFPASPSDPVNSFQETSSETNGFFQTPSLSTSPFLSNRSPASEDVFKTSTAGTNVSDPLFDPPNQAQSKHKSQYDRLFTRQDGKQDSGISHDALQNGGVQETTPFTNVSNGDLMFRRLPPKAAPRSKAPKILPQPPALSQMTPAETERDLQVFEDVLLIGQERCVEDWPEHSPELASEEKPVSSDDLTHVEQTGAQTLTLSLFQAGKIRLRRDSVKIPDASDGGADGTLKRNGKQTLGRKLRHSLLIRRSSKDITRDELKSSETNTSSLNPGSKLIDGTDEFFTPEEEEEQNEAAEHTPV
ncbi:uncharacterized protein LOC132115617 [Carassius carassius]|uniref:uncharacterized protein LOC132115617 n=1 Tax=Carassius carassius TaxID=217509 RepID=UPI0028683C23|nr:uncharacterized protein LOC132115617 [Carassius carassius]